MKIRNGFVSNSSSSSFIIAVAQIINREKVDSWIGSLSLDPCDYTIQKVKDLNDRCGQIYTNKKGDIIAHNFQTTVYLSDSLINSEDEILAINIVNNEWDYGSFSSDYGDEINYDIDLDFFDDNQTNIYCGLCEENGFGLIDKTYGAGRNG
jgi:hypothetical protein